MTDPRPNDAATLRPDPVTLACADGQRLQGHFFAARGDATAAPVLISPATGVRQQFYWRFADWLAGQGHPVLVFDYRGIGLSLEGSLADSRARLVDWGRLDQVAALQWLLERTGAAQVVLVGHSAGAQMIGLLPNHERIARLVGVAASTGWFGGMRLAFALKARFGLRLMVPIGTLFKGYAPTAWLGLGENLPAQVGRQWGQWCAAGGYATNAVRAGLAADFHAQVRTPIVVLHAEDDDIATPETVRDLLRTLPASPRATLRVRPRDHGLRAIGHLDWFRQSHQALWPLLRRAVVGEVAVEVPVPG
ncbi:alpha/beta fold hydrolase [Scleromatobacter humisilvae]|uniref:Alpha/beta fold hydrolase n=1 Tax=Scleromatobacter humisilvae TaxID=2897159 RepID=A0A9X1YNG1_9BURK|nr:alpha/beta fold hydrolase [Scleromatobacter humisilvae]MCK9689022.1 alpha/beta fold hydrolase [Scleromatobacter humisilvae]